MAKAPERKRPPGRSVLLIPEVETLNMPVNTAPEPEVTAIAAPLPAHPAHEKTVPAEEPVMQPAESSVSAPDDSEQGFFAESPEAMSPESNVAVPVEIAHVETSTSAPAAQVPVEVPVGDLALAPEQTAAAETAPDHETVPVSAPEAAAVVAQAPEGVSVTAAAPVPELYIPPNMKQPVTINMRTALKLRAETAVLRTGHLQGGYRSQVQLIEAALEKELTRLESEFNKGEQFPPNVGTFRTGRPLGS